MSTSGRVPLVRPSAVGARLAALVAALLAASVVALAPSAAQAASSSDADSRSDVVVQGGAAPGRVDAGRSNGDVTSVRVVHGRRAVSLELRFATLQATGSWHRHWFRMVTDEGVRRELAVTAGPGAWQGRAQLTGVDRSPEGCVLRSTIGYGAGATVRVVVPRACLSSPAWVRVAAGTVTASGTRVWADDARTRGQLWDAPVFGPRVHRG
ncbi:hypothetical protein ASG49_13075 [Marmoricola sp. Leaf446]|uniref:hypothetical protein n=1 Tax=Marmoricola sp. Leaf446 TaxID=1736379 RepID=UPI0006FB080D|nr:hypothetical protein [Marmoricola sp. Leaf446]KQT90689.1 hypothetical protein ASG49_13075 [Marmoricola sp. Leaf446]